MSRRRGRRNPSDADAIFVDYLLGRGSADDEDYYRLGGEIETDPDSLAAVSAWELRVDPKGHVLFEHFTPIGILDEIESRGLLTIPAGDYVAKLDGFEVLHTSHDKVPRNFSSLWRQLVGKKSTAKYRPRDIWLVPSEASGSDYSGYLVNRSNLETLTEIAERGDLFERDQAAVLSGGYGSYGIAIRGDVNYEDMVDALKSLRDDYPILDEDHYYQVEAAAIDEAYPDVMREFADLLQRRLPSIDTSHPEYSTVVEEVFAALEPDWEEEPGGNMHVNAHQLMSGLDNLPVDVELRLRSIMSTARNGSAKRSRQPKRKLMR